MRIQDRDSGYLADVTTAHRVAVDSEAGTVSFGGATWLRSWTYGVAFTQPNGDDVLITSTASGTVFPDCGVVAGVVLDSSSAATLAIKSGTAVWWQGTLGAAGGHLNDTFDGGIWQSTSTGLTATLTGTGQYIVYGYAYSCARGGPGVHGRSGR